jgi:hypothetical protein
VHPSLTRLAWPLAALPSPLGYAWASVEVSRYEGWGQWAAAPLLLVPLGYGALVALAAGVAALLAWRARRPVWMALLGVVIALAPWLHVLARNLVR